MAIAVARVVPAISILEDTESNDGVDGCSCDDEPDWFVGVPDVSGVEELPPELDEGFSEGARGVTEESEGVTSSACAF